MKRLACLALALSFALIALPAQADLLGNVTLGRDGSCSPQVPAVTFQSEPTLGFARTRTGTMGVCGGGLSQKEISATVTPGSQAANTCAPQSFSVSGVNVGDRVVLVSYPATGNATGYGAAQVSAANTVAQTVCNPTAGALTPAAGSFTYIVFPLP